MKIMKMIQSRRLFSVLFFLLVFPASDTYSLKSFSFGAGGGTAASDTYQAEVLAGEVAGSTQDGVSYDFWPGMAFTQFANVPPAPTFTNSGDFNNKLLIVINAGGNSSNTKFAIAISTDNFSTTNYVQSDNTVGATLGAEDWQTYSGWGSGGGEFIVGLDPGTTYYVKVKSEQGLYTEGPWGPTASAATSGSTLSFDIDVSASDEETGAPYSLSLGTLTSGSVVTSTSSIWIDLSTNAAAGGSVYVYGSSGGLYSASSGYTISGVSADLSATSEGFGLRSTSVTQGAGGPLAAVSPYNGASDNVGTVATTAQPIYTSTAAPITSGRASFVVKAKAQAVTPAAGDYTEILTLIAAGTF